MLLEGAAPTGVTLGWDSAGGCPPSLTANGPAQVRAHLSRLRAESNSEIVVSELRLAGEQRGRRKQKGSDCDISSQQCAGPCWPTRMQALYTHCACDGSNCHLSCPQMTASGAPPSLPSLPPTPRNIQRAASFCPSWNFKEMLGSLRALEEKRLIVSTQERGKSPSQDQH